MLSRSPARYQSGRDPVQRFSAHLALVPPKTIDLYATGDSVCNGAAPGPPSGAHNAYIANGMVDQAA
ncbi:hypothetical protein [Mycolicibacterium lutetiense]|uniref:Cutinase n=1 Tax=Mycolicibacterium lutetiense TaxID=1641992 RepID=A0ABS4ZS42_9MYCO|nr:hypothetical protein [Mycolicibacterium lutetiense]